MTMIRFHCLAEGCGKKLTVADAAAGRKGKCPGCGASIVVPMATPAMAPEPAPSLVVAEMVEEAVYESAPAAPPVHASSGVWEEDEVGPPGPSGRAISWGAIGVAWRLLREQLGTWILTTFVLYLSLMGLGIILQLGMAAGLAIGVGLLGPIAVPVVMGTMFFLNMGVQGIVYGGLFGMALKQVDGGEVAVGDLFSIGGEGRAERLFKAGILMGVLGMLGFVFLFIPGLVFFGLSFFSIPLIVDGRMGAWAALKMSLRALGRDWISAALFILAMMALATSGMLLLGLGVLFTIPWCVLSCAVQYRRSFAAGAKPRARIIADPHAEAIGIPEDEREVPEVPVLAWGLMGGALIVPAALVAVALTVASKVWEASMDGGREQIAGPFSPAPGEPRALTKGEPRPIEAAPGRPFPVPVPVAPPAPVALKGPGAAEALAGLRGGKSERLDALRWLDSNAPAADEPRQAEIGQALSAILLEHPNEANMAAHGLVRWATIKDLPALAAASWYEHPPAVSMLAKQALQRLRDAEGTEGRKAIDEAVERGRETARLDAVRIALAETMSEDEGTRFRAVQRLRRMPVVPQLQGEVVSAMKALIQDHTSNARTDAVGTIGVWARPGDEKILLAVLEDKADRRFARPTALEALARSKDPEVIARIVAVGQDRAVRSQAMKAIRDYGPLAEPALINLLKDESPDARTFACQMLDTVGTEKCLPALKEAIDDDNGRVSARAKAAVLSLERKLGSADEEVKRSPRRPPSRSTRKRARTPTAPRSPEGRQAG